MENLALLVFLYIIINYGVIPSVVCIEGLGSCHAAFTTEPLNAHHFRWWTQSDLHDIRYITLNSGVNNYSSALAK